MRSAGRASLLSALFVLGLGAFGFAQAAKADPVRAAIEKQNAAFSAAFARGDVAALAAAYTEDAIAFPPDADMVRGRAAIQALWQSLRDAGAKSVTLKTIDVDAGGRLAAETGTAVLKIQPPNAAEQSQMVKYVVVWKRQADGSWKLYRDIWNAMPAATR
jgi:uncharacterized protein (TIGR02246 family)